MWVSGQEQEEMKGFAGLGVGMVMLKISAIF